MATQASREDRISAISAALLHVPKIDLGGHFLRAGEIRRIAETAVDAVIAADNTEAGRRADIRRADELRRYWSAFCDADPVPNGFIDSMEEAGLAEMRPVTQEDLRSSFAADRGIRKGEMVWDLTLKGRDILAPKRGL